MRKGKFPALIEVESIIFLHFAISIELNNNGRGNNEPRKVYPHVMDFVESTRLIQNQMPPVVAAERLRQRRREILSGQNVKRTMKLTISLAYYMVIGLRRVFTRLVGRSQERGLVILYYHGIPDAYRSDFVRQLEAIQRTARVLPASHRGAIPSDKPNVAITFDDAYVSVARNALPALTARGFHSTIFVPTAMLGGSPTWQMEESSPDVFEVVMPAEQIATLWSPLVTLGSHSCTHPRLSRLADGEARKEIEGSRVALQTLTEQDILSFALPYGDHNSSTIEMCKTAGYEMVFSTIPAPVDTRDTAFVRGRVKADPFDGRLEFFLKYNGAYAWIRYASALKRRLRGYTAANTSRESSLGKSAPHKLSKGS